MSYKLTCSTMFDPVGRGYYLAQSLRGQSQTVVE